MISRICRVGLALVAALTVAAAARAAEPGGGPGMGGFGGTLGLSSYSLDRTLGSDWFTDYSYGAQKRMSFDAHWRYGIAKNWRAQLAAGFSWAGYSGEHHAGVPKYPAPFVDPNFPEDTLSSSAATPEKSHYLTQMLPVSLQIQYLHRKGPWAYHIGAGPGVYRVWVENHRKVLKDPVSLKLHRGLYPGGSAQIGVEKFLTGNPQVSLEADLAGHLAFVQRPDQFVSGMNSNVMAMELRVGGNYYFTPGPRKAPATTPKIP